MTMELGVIRTWCAGALVVFCASLCLAGEREDGRAIANELVRRAATLSNPTAPLRLRGTFRVPAVKGNIEGQYELTYISPEQQKEILSFADYQEIRVVLDGKQHIQRNRPYQPLPIHLLFRSLSPQIVPPLMPQMASPAPAKAETPEIQKTKINGTSATCAEVASKRRLCFAVPTGTLLERTDPSGLKWVYSDYLPFRDRLLPRLIKAYDSDQLMVEMKIDDISEPPSTTQMVAPKPALTLGWCKEEPFLSLAERQPPQYPLSAKNRGEAGTVGVYVIVGSDGRLRNPSVVRTAGSDLDRATLANLPTWRYAPVLCGGVAVDFETYIRVHFSLGGR